MATQEWTTNQKPAPLIDSTADYDYNTKVSIPGVVGDLDEDLDGAKEVGLDELGVATVVDEVNLGQDHGKVHHLQIAPA